MNNIDRAWHRALHAFDAHLQDADSYNRTLSRQRYGIENAFGRIKEWRRISTRCNRCAHTFQSAICIAVIVTF